MTWFSSCNHQIRTHKCILFSRIAAAYCDAECLFSIRLGDYVIKMHIEIIRRVFNFQTIRFAYNSNIAIILNQNMACVLCFVMWCDVMLHWFGLVLHSVASDRTKVPFTNTICLPKMQFHDSHSGRNQQFKLKNSHNYGFAILLLCMRLCVCFFSSSSLEFVLIF